jgi:hypothetical protein
MNDIILFLQNGLYIPFVFGFTYLFTNHFFLSIIVSLKMYPTNYFYWFNDYYHYKNIPKKLNWVKQFVRFTDTGHLVSFLYYFNPSFLVIGYNVHFVITFGYWIGQLCFKLKDCDSINDSRIIKKVEHFFCACNHSVPLLLFIYEIKTNSAYAIFDMNSLYYSYLWAYIWLLTIYIPWIYTTQDYVYSIMFPSVPLNSKIFFVGFIHILFFIANYVGFYLTN